MRLLLLLPALLSLGLALPAAGQAPDAAIRVEPEVQLEGPAPASTRGKGRAVRAVQIALEPPSPQELAQIGRPRKGVPHRIGFPRPVPALESAAGAGRVLEWAALADGASVAAVAVTSPEAAALRFGLRVTDVPGEAIFRFHDPDGQELFQVSGATILAAIAANVAAGEHGVDARTYWSPVIEASTAVMEVELPAGARPGELRMTIAQVAHLVASAKTDFMAPKAAAACNLDATCQVGSWGTQINAISRMVFSSGGFQYVCTGTLLADTDAATTVPFFLTARHCIGTQAEATSLVNYWFFRSSACNSGAPSGAAVQQPGGGTLLHQSTTTDVSFLRLNQQPPAGATYAGWKAGPVLPLSAAVTGLHHPAGDLLKISGANVVSYHTCTAPNGDGEFSCSSSSAAASTFYGVSWSSGVVEGGSSGSALFDSGKYVVGQLYGGSSTCADPQAGDVYGRFDVSYNAALAPWLNPAAPPQQLTVSKAGAGAGTVTSAPSGINCGSTCSVGFPGGSSVTLTASSIPGVSTFGGWSGGCSGTGSCTVTMNAPVAVTAIFNQDLGVAVSPASLVFGSAQASQDVTFTNNTGAKVTFTQASTNSARFATTNNCGEVTAGASCIVTVTYNPANNGTDTATLIVSSTAFASPHGVALWAASAETPRLVNISTRMQALAGSDVMIGGFIVGGTTPKTVVVRARGPSLAQFGIYNHLPDPLLQLFSGPTQIAVNNNYPDAANLAQLQASGFAPDVAQESAILTTLAPGPYTAIVSGVGGGTGVAIVEVFEVDHAEVPLVNISTRGQVRGGNDAMIGGFIIQGSAPKTVVVRARGPSLAAAGVPGTLANPRLQLVRSSDQSAIAFNDDWGTAANSAQISSSGFAPADGLEAAILMTLAPGAYTAIVTGVGGGTGVGIVEVFGQ